jgi:hypothetical protein
MTTLLIVTMGEDMDPDEARAAVQHAIDTDPACPPAQVDIPGR